jgi:hypothetical protein
MCSHVGAEPPFPRNGVKSLSMPNLLRLLDILRAQGPSWDLVRRELVTESASDLAKAFALVEKWAKESQEQVPKG